jgi:hypothetical protein
MKAITYGLIVVLVVAALGVYSLLPAVEASPTSGTVSSTTTVTTATSCSTSSLGGPSPTTLNGTYTPPRKGTDVRIDYVKALIYPGEGTPSTLRFQVGFTNVGNSSIYILTGCGSTLNSTITSGSQVVRTASGGPRCLCAEALSPLSPGLSATEFDPGCWSSYSYQVVQAGTITARLTLSWYGGNEFSSPSSVQITANFTIP